VPRGGGPAYSPARGAQVRHPRGGSGYASYRPPSGHYPAYGHGRYPAHGYGRYPAYGYGRYYRPYYPYYGYGGYYGWSGYYGSSFGISVGFGSPYAYGYWGWPDGGYPYAAAPATEVYVTREVPPRESVPDIGRVPNTGRIRLEVRPDDATVYVDDEFWGSAADSRLLTLRAGRHTIELVRPGFGVERRDVEVVPGTTSDVLVELPRP
jgi:hypothetical protein